MDSQLQESMGVAGDSHTIAVRARQRTYVCYTSGAWSNDLSMSLTLWRDSYPNTASREEASWHLPGRTPSPRCFLRSLQDRSHMAPGLASPACPNWASKLLLVSGRRSIISCLPHIPETSGWPSSPRCWMGAILWPSPLRACSGHHWPGVSQPGRASADRFSWWPPRSVQVSARSVQVTFLLPCGRMP